MSVAVGAPVTLIRRGLLSRQQAQILQTHVVSHAVVWSHEGFIASGSGRRALFREGVTWIRGHHPEDSPEVLALRTAHALVIP